MNRIHNPPNTYPHCFGPTDVNRATSFHSIAAALFKDERPSCASSRVVSFRRVLDLYL